MVARIVRIVFVCAFALVPCAAFAEDGPGPEMQEMFQQFQQMRQQVMQNMLEKGIDPREFFGDMRQQMQDGTFDMEAFQQKLVDKGLIEKEAITKMQTTAQSATLGSIKRQLAVTNDEWAALQPKIQRVITAQGDAESSNQLGGMMAGFIGRQSGTSDVTKKTRELREAVADPAAKPDDIQQKLAALRGAKQKAKDELAAARKELLDLLVARQEAVLTMLGLL